MKNSKLLLLWFITFVLIGCSGQQTPTKQLTAKPPVTPVIQTSTALPTFPSNQTPTLLPTLSLKDLRFAYINDGNLYLQDSGEKPIRLTNSGEDHNPIFSDDGKKIVFFRGVIPHDMYSINVDGSQEQALVPSELLAALGVGYGDFTEPRSMAFVPSTHLLLFNTHEFMPTEDKLEDSNRFHAKSNQDLLIVDTDTTEIKRLLKSGEAVVFQISPNGKLVGIQASNHINVIGLDDKIIRQNLITFPPAWFNMWEPDIFWTQDSSKLNVVLPIVDGNALNQSGPEPRVIQQYPMDGTLSAEIHLDPPPIGDSFSISPDGNWVFYNYYYYPGKTDETVTAGSYIGNLRDGSSQLVMSLEESSYLLLGSFNWSPDSKHVISEGQLNLFLSDTNGTISPLTNGRFLGWVDNSKYLYFYGGVAMGNIETGEHFMVANIPTPEYVTFVIMESKTNQ